MKKHQKTISICAGILIILGLIFYWFFYRPSNIVKNCSFEAKEKATNNSKDRGKDGKYTADERDAFYKWCLQEKGLVK